MFGANQKLNQVKSHVPVDLGFASTACYLLSAYGDFTGTLLKCYCHADVVRNIRGSQRLDLMKC